MTPDKAPEFIKRLADDPQSIEPVNVKYLLRALVFVVADQRETITVLQRQIDNMERGDPLRRIRA